MDTDGPSTILTMAGQKRKTKTSSGNAVGLKTAGHTLRKAKKGAAHKNAGKDKGEQADSGKEEALGHLSAVDIQVLMNTKEDGLTKCVLLKRCGGKGTHISIPSFHPSIPYLFCQFSFTNSFSFISQRKSRLI